MKRNERKIWNRFAHIYDFIMKKDKAAYGKIIEDIRQILKPEDNVLEIATGTGIIALGLSGSVNRLSAVDFSPVMINKAKQKAEKIGVEDINFLVQDATCLDFDKEMFDYVIISNALHIIPEPEKVLDEIKRVLVKNGKVIAPTFTHKENKKAEWLSKVMNFTGFHAHHKWTLNEYKKFIEEQGFCIECIKVHKATFPIAYVVMKMA